MKRIVTGLIASLVTISALAETPPLVFRSVFEISSNPLYSVSTVDATAAAWVSVGDRFRGYEIVAFAKEERVLIVSREGNQWRIPLAHVTGGKITRASTLEEDLRSAKELSPEAKIELIIRNTVAESETFVRLIDNAQSSDEVVRIIDEHSSLIALLEFAGREIVEESRRTRTSTQAEAMMVAAVARMPDTIHISDAYHKTLASLRNSYQDVPEVQAALRNLEAERRGNERPTNR